ncbi:hypothetical protein L1887_17582 [Cichorium endivia]|nr:hypothetical protein L1887_17582 [Cichorium endivia]
MKNIRSCEEIGILQHDLDELQKSDMHADDYKNTSAILRTRLEKLLKKRELRKSSRSQVDDSMEMENLHEDNEYAIDTVTLILCDAENLQTKACAKGFQVIKGNVQPGDLCTRREYVRWLISATTVLSRNTLSKVYPAMYIENVTELAFDDITPEEDPDFSSIQGLAEAGLIASKLSQRDMNISNEDENSLNFCPESLSRQDLPQIIGKPSLSLELELEVSKELAGKSSAILNALVIVSFR